MKDFIDKEKALYDLEVYAYKIDPMGFFSSGIKRIIEAIPTERLLSEDDYTELRDRFGEFVEFVVRDMASEKGERWKT